MPPQSLGVINMAHGMSLSRNSGEHPVYQLKIRQQPECARVAIGKEKGRFNLSVDVPPSPRAREITTANHADRLDRKPIDPPPIIQLSVSSVKDPHQNFLQNPYFMMTAKLVRSNEAGDAPEDHNVKENALIGTIVSSLYSLKDTDNNQGGFFVFGDLSVKIEGWFKLEFSLYEIRDRECYTLATTTSKQFQVFQQKYFPGMAESTFLTRSFSDQGVRLRLRKDSRSMTTRKRNANVADFARSVNGRHDLDSSQQNGRDHQLGRQGSIHDNGMDRARGSMGSQSSGYYGNSPQLPQEYAHDSAPYGYGYDDRPGKRQRFADVNDRSVAYDHHDYSPYSAGPRTVPDLNTATGLIPSVPPTSYPSTSHTSMAGLPPMPSGLPYAMPPRLDTQMAPHSAGPSSAASNFSPGTRRSPPSAYQYGPPHSVMYASSPAAAMPYHTGATQVQQSNGLGHANGLGLMSASLDLESVDSKGSGGGPNM